MEKKACNQFGDVCLGHRSPASSAGSPSPFHVAPVVDTELEHLSAFWFSSLPDERAFWWDKEYTITKMILGFYFWGT